jgi:DNA invertase Pin-like site-specific DNA recombinase
MNDLCTMRFAFYGRVSTEDNQDPEASRNWQISRATGLIEPAGGKIVTEFFDIGLSRSIPWQRRRRAAELLTAIANPDRGFEAVVIGEPQRAFYGGQYGLTMPLFTHFGVGLWVPEVGGAIDPDSEAHDLIMSVFGGMSKGERNRIKIRVRSAMAAQAKIEGRYLGRRPPYGYRLADAGPHPNPAKAADGKRLHKLEPHPDYGPVVTSIFKQYLRGRGLYAIAEELTASATPSPSQADPARNAHRTGEGWSKSAIKVILENPRYTGRQVWNKQRKQGVLLDLGNVADGYETKLKWNKPGDWVWSDQIVHDPLVSVEDFETAQEIRAASGRGRDTRERKKVRRDYILRGLLYCGLCERKMQAQHTNGRAMYRCRYAREYALANHVQHPLNVYLKEEAVVPVLDGWIAKLFAPHRINDTIRQLAAHQAAASIQAPPELKADTDALLKTYDAKLATYRAALEAGADPATVGEWIAEVKAQRAAITAQANMARTTAEPNERRLNEEEIAGIVRTLGSMRTVIQAADPAEKARVYSQLGLRLTYQPEKHEIRAQINLDPDISGVIGRVRGVYGKLRRRNPMRQVAQINLAANSSKLAAHSQAPGQSRTL